MYFKLGLTRLFLRPFNKFSTPLQSLCPPTLSSPGPFLPRPHPHCSRQQVGWPPSKTARSGGSQGWCWASQLPAPIMSPLLLECCVSIHRSHRACPVSMRHRPGKVTYISGLCNAVPSPSGHVTTVQFVPESPPLTTRGWIYFSVEGTD